jgi:hypothetical protein
VKPYSNVHVGASITPSRLMNSCTPIAPTFHLPVDARFSSDGLESGNSSLQQRAREVLVHRRYWVPYSDSPAASRPTASQA